MIAVHGCDFLPANDRLHVSFGADALLFCRRLYGQSLGIALRFCFNADRFGAGLYLDLLYFRFGARFDKQCLAIALGGKHAIHDLLQVSREDKVLHVVPSEDSIDAIPKRRDRSRRCRISSLRFDCPITRESASSVMDASDRRAAEAAHRCRGRSSKFSALMIGGLWIGHDNCET